MKSKVQRLQEEHGIVIDKLLETDLEKIMEESTNKYTNRTLQDHFFIYFGINNFRQSRLRIVASFDDNHPMIVKWCLKLKLMSSRSYNAVWSTLVLPSECMLRDYTHCFESKPGFDDELDKQLMKEAQVDTIQDFQKYVCLVLDEVRVKEGLVYDKHSLQVIGFVNLGDINNQLLNFERAQTNNSQEAITPPIAKHMLVFMVRGIFSELEFPYVRFPCANTSGDIVFSTRVGMH